MAWEDRNGRQYYYSKSRQDGRVISQYLGAGEIGGLAATLERARQAERAAERAERRRQIEADQALDREITEVAKLVQTVTAVALLAGGCHRPKRQWRVKRGQSREY